MKKIISLGIILGVTSMIFVGCVHKTVHGVDRCGNAQNNHRAMTEDCKQECTENSLDVACVRAAKNVKPVENIEVKSVIPKDASVLEKNKSLKITVLGQGVAPTTTVSPAQAYALAKRAAVADSYRLIAEKVRGVYVEGEDLIQNMMVKRSSIRTSVSAMVKNANVVETTFKEGLCEVEMEIVLSHAQFGR